MAADGIMNSLKFTESLQVHKPQPVMLLSFLAAVTLPLWILMYYYPNTNLRIFSLGVFLVYAAGLPVLLKRKIQVRRYVPYLIFAGVHVLSLVIYRNSSELSFTLELLGSIVFFIVVTENLRGFEVYSAALHRMMVASGVLILVLLYKHLFVYRSIYFSPYLDFHEWQINGVSGAKNTVAFFLCFLFPFIYARFTYHETPLTGFFLFVVSFSALYTLSRMALVSLVFALIGFVVFSFDRKKHLRQLAAIGIILFVMQTVFHIGMSTFFELKAKSMGYVPGAGSQGHIEPQRIANPQYYLHHSYRVRNLVDVLNGFHEKPVLGHGIHSFVSKYHHATHNDFTQILYELGLVGFVSFVMIFWVHIRKIFAVRRAIPPEYYWLWEAQAACFLSLFFCLLFIEAYKSLPFWFMLAGNEIIFQSTLKKAEDKILAVTVFSKEGKPV